MTDEILQLEPIQCVPVTRNLSLYFELLFCKETIVQCVVPENIHTPHGGQLIDFASIILGIIHHYDHNFQCMYFPKKALLA